MIGEYQYYEFAAVDRPLDSRELAQVRALSTRAQITSTSFVNTYHWGDFRGSPRAMVERYYDAFLYLANWGTRQLLLKEVTGKDEFARRIEALRDEHRRKPAFVERLVAAGLTR